MRRRLLIPVLLACTGFRPLIAADDKDQAKDKGEDKDQAKNEDEEDFAERKDWQVPVTLGKDGWMLYENPRFGFVIPVPPGMQALRPPDNGGGQAFTSADGKITLTSYGSHNVDNMGDVEANWKDELAAKGRTITYKRKEDGWYVISGVMDNGTGFYTRYEADKEHSAGWSLTYPRKDEKRCAALVERIAKGYEARLGKGQD